MTGEVRLACGCTLSGSDADSLVDPLTDVLLDVDAECRVLRCFPHESDLLSANGCNERRLEVLLPGRVVDLLRDRVKIAMHSQEPHSIDVELDSSKGRAPRDPVTRSRREESTARVRIAPHPEGARILLRDVHYRLDALLHSARKVEPSFWELFEAAPIPLAIEFATNEQIEGSTRLNRQFIQTFGYTEREVPTVQHWWSLAYRDEDYREQTRREWFARVQKAMAGGRPIEPIAATVVCKDGTKRDILFGAARVGEHHVVTFIDLTQEKQIERKLARKVEELARALSNVRELSGLLPLCAWCHKLRDDEGYWRNVEEFLTRHTEVTHSICPDCRKSSFG